MKVAALVLCIGVTTARAEVGAMAGARSVSLAGDVDDDSHRTFALAGIAMRALPHGFSAGVEPGIRISGSRTFRLIDVVAGVAGRYTHGFTGAHRLRLTVAAAPAYRLASQRRELTDYGIEWERLRGIRRWDVDAIAGVGYEHAGPTVRLFVELRYAAGLTSVDVREMPLAIYRRELGLWLGVTR